MKARTGFLKEYFMSLLAVKNKSEAISNLKRNWYFPVSAFVFFFLEADLSPASLVSLFITMLFPIVIATQVESMQRYVRTRRNSVCVLGALSSLGVCLGAGERNYLIWGTAELLTEGIEKPVLSSNLALCLSAVAVLLSAAFVYICLVWFWDKLTEIFRETGAFKDLKTSEIVVYALIVLATLLLVGYSFMQSQAFYGTDLKYDIIYTSDSPSFLTENVYVTRTHPENDLRQPLFAVFAAPFVGIAYGIAQVLFLPQSVSAMLQNFVQVLMMLMANYLLARMLRLTALRRTCFMALFSCTYTYLLFSLMMEQYIVGYFWLVLLMYTACEGKDAWRPAFYGTCGTLLTGAVLAPLMSHRSPLREFKKWFWDMVRCAVEFAALILICGRLDIVTNLYHKVAQLTSFTGEEVTFSQKIYQYFSFVAGCFRAPSAGVTPNAEGYTSWQLETVTGLSVVGIVILVLAVVSGILSRKNKVCLIATGWVCMSVVMLLVLGWGTAENGLVLYSLYFGWAFVVLLFNLADMLQTKLGVSFLLPSVTAVSCVFMLAVNIPSLAEMINFAIECYPV